MVKRRMPYRLLLGVIVILTTVSAWGLVAAQDSTPEAVPDTSESTTPTERPYLGVRLEDGDGGAVIREVAAGSPAETAALQVGDVIIKVNDTPVTGAQEAVDAIRVLSAGDNIMLEIQREDETETQTITVTLGSAPADVSAPQTPFRDQNFGLSYNADNQTWTIERLSEDSALYEAGLRQGDIIQQFDGQSYDPRGLIEHLATLGVEGSVTVTIERDGSTQDIDVPLMALFEMAGMGFGRPGQGFQMPFGMGSGVINGWLGVQFVTLDEQSAEENNVTATEGALVKEVVENSPAAEAGLQVNDIILAVNGEPVDTEWTLRDRLMAYEPEDTVTLNVQRGDETLEIEVTLGEVSMDAMMPFFGEGRPFGHNGGQWNAPQAPEQPEAQSNM
jgi:S1-C subfamily serine protease